MDLLDPDANDATTPAQSHTAELNLSRVREAAHGYAAARMSTTLVIAALPLGILCLICLLGTVSLVSSAVST